MKSNAGIRPRAGQAWVCRDGRTLEPDFLAPGDLKGFTAQQVTFAATDGSLTGSTSLTYDGSRLLVGNGTPSADLAAVLVCRAITTTPNDHGFREESSVTVGAGAGGFCSYDSLPSFAGAATYDHLHGYQARPLYNGSGSVIDLAGYWSQVGHTGAGTATNAKGLWVKDPSGAGAITNNYGVYIEAMTRGGTLNYAIYTVGTAPSVFGGALSVTGSIIGSDIITVTGNVRSTTGLFEGPDQGGFVTNAYYSAGWKYRGNGGATRFVHNTATATISAAAVGVANAAITWLDGIGVVESAGAVAVGLYGTTPAIQYATNGFTGGFTAGAGSAVDSAATFTGNTGATAYTITDIVRCLKKLGAMAA